MQVSVSLAPVSGAWIEFNASTGRKPDLIRRSKCLKFKWFLYYTISRQKRSVPELIRIRAAIALSAGMVDNVHHILPERAEIAGSGDPQSAEEARHWLDKPVQWIEPKR